MIFSIVVLSVARAEFLGINFGNVEPKMNITCDSFDQSIRCETECVETFTECAASCLGDQGIG